MLSSSLITHLESSLSKIEQEAVEILGSKNVSGGSINDAYELKTTLGSYFIKTNSASKYPNMFEAEARGLEVLSKKSSLETPKVVTTGTAGDLTYLVCNYIESGRLRQEYWEDFGSRLARMHQNTQSYFGLDHNNYMGAVPQNNEPCSTWGEFFVENRLRPLVNQSRKLGLLSKPIDLKFQRLYRSIPAIFPEEKPALLHGDLWAGNCMAGSTGVGCIFDPAIYYGHREMDIAMTRLFGGFAPDFYRGYNETYPLSSGWEERISIANLYPLLIHVVLFGGGYVRQVEDILKRF